MRIERSTILDTGRARCKSFLQSSRLGWDETGMDVILSPEQRTAVETVSRAVVVVAAAGNGKTEVVAQRLERLLREGESDGPRVLALTYTTKAADELRERLRIRLGDLARRVDAETTHGFAFDLLRRYGTRIGLPQEPEVLSRDEDRAELLAEWLAATGQDLPDDIKQTLGDIDLARARGEDASLLDEMRAALLNRGAVDYPAMLEHATDLLGSRWLKRQMSALYSHLVVDEAQNLTSAQYALLTQLIGEPSAPHLNTMLVGDERQSIVGFAGADARLIKKFQADYSAERIVLTTNFRSADRIVAVGRRVAVELELTSMASPQTYSAPGLVEYEELSSEVAEAEYLATWVESLLQQGIDESALAPGESLHVGPSEIAILTRAAAALRFTRAALERRQISVAMSVSPEDWVRSPAAKLTTAVISHLAAPEHRSVRRAITVLCGGDPGWSELSTVIADADQPDLRELKGLCDLKDVSELLPYLQAITVNDPDWDDDLDQFRQVWGTFIDRYGFGERTFANLRQHIARTQRGDNLSDGVRLLTVHKAQGREFRAVALAACNEGQLPDFRATSAEDVKGELRIFYVAVTRPARMLLLTRSTTRETRFGPRPTRPSSFLDLVHIG